MDEILVKTCTLSISESNPTNSVATTKAESFYKPLLDVDQDLILLDSSHEENSCELTANGIIVGLKKSPQLHARSLLKSPEASHKLSSRDPVLCEETAETLNAYEEENKLDNLIKILAKESTTVMQIDVAKEKERMESTSHPKLNSHLLNIPNNQTHKSSNLGSAKPLAPEQLKCNILKGT